MSSTWWNVVYYLSIAVLILVPGYHGQTIGESDKNVAIRESLLLVSTLDGSLHAVSQRSGFVHWSIADVPILQMSPIANISEGTKHLLLPDPKDGTLYLFNGLNNEKTPKMLEKLPFTISELVSTSPCRSSDGMIYTSKKVDEWLVLDIRTGEKVDVINVDSPTCPTKAQFEHLPNRLYQSHNLLYIFKSEYQISTFNAENREKISNFTFVDYSPSIISSINQNSYEFLHLASSHNGKLATIDISNGVNSFLWSHQFSSPIVAMFKLGEKSNFPIMHRVPFLTLGGFINISNFLQINSLFSSVYIGELTHSKSLYALSALVDYNSIRKDSNYLLEGPKNEERDKNSKPEYLGYYKFPEKTDVKFQIIPKSQLIPYPIAPVPYESEEPKLPQNINTTLDDISLKIENYTLYLQNLAILVFIILFIILAVISIVAYYYFIHHKSSNAKEKLSNKNISIGKISYNPVDIIGRGCAGTCVYKGFFEGRQEVAVKRIVSDCFKLANREIELLRKLQHPHLIRYFATEYDQQFLYIAIELAEMTLWEYFEKKSDDFMIDINKSELLLQACQGLAHLHSLDIVHRDIKPQNILISLPMSPNRRRKIMISDFGVSKVLNSESLTTDFSAGTEGWIAPEILRSKLQGNNEKASKPNDIFSMGCLIYYTYTEGQHPFGNLLNRQTNIMHGNVDLSAISGEGDLSLYSLVEPMVALDAEERPSIEVVLKHPYFWNAKQSLQFLQDVSDRFECESPDSEIIQMLEGGSYDVCRGDWRRAISLELQEDLRKFRSYKGSSVRDLLRAIRNKRHHYHELDPKLQQSLGSIPNEFVRYFTSKFPRLIIHSYIAMQVCASEDLFQNYYHYCESGSNFRFKVLPRSSIRWFERLKDDKPKDFVFEVRHRTTKKEKEKPSKPSSHDDQNIHSDSSFYNDVFNG